MKKTINILLVVSLLLSCFACAVPVLAAQTEAKVVAVTFEPGISEIPEYTNGYDYGDGYYYDLLNNGENLIIDYDDGSRHTFYSMMLYDFIDYYEYTVDGWRSLSEFTDEVPYTTGDARLPASQLEIGKEYKYKVSFGGVESNECSFTIVENPVESINYELENSIVIGRENGYRSYDVNGNGYWHYELINVPSVIYVTYKDNSVGTVAYSYGYSEIWGMNGYFAEDGSELPNFYDERYFTTDGIKQRYAPWGTGVHKFTVSYYGKTDECEFTVIDNSIGRVEFTPGCTSVTEGDKTEWNVTSDTDFYDVTYMDGNTWTVCFSEGSGIESKTYIVDNGEIFCEDSGEYFWQLPYEVEVVASPSPSQWQAGNTYTYSFTFDGVETNSASLTIEPNGIEKIEYIPAFDEVVENTNCSWWSKGESTVSIPHYDVGCNEGDTLVVYYTDKTKTPDEYVYSNWEAEFMCDGEALPFGDSLRIYSNQYDEPWLETGMQYTYKVHYLGRTAEAQLTLLENPVQSFIYDPERDFYVGVDCYLHTIYDEDGERECYEYYIGADDGDLLYVNYKDGSSVAYFYNSETGLFEPKDGSGNYAPISTEDLYFDSNQMEHPWEVDGEYNYYTVSYAGLQFNVYINLLDPIAKIEYKPAISGAVVNSHGWYGRFNDERFFYYDIEADDGNELTVYYNDENREPETYVYGYDESLEYGGFFCNGKELENADKWLSFTNDQWENHWTEVDKEYKYTVTYCGKSTEVGFTVLPSPVVSIEYTPAQVFVEGVDMYEYSYWDEELQEYVEKMVYSVYFGDGDKLTIGYNDGRVIDYVYEYGEFVPTADFPGESNIWPYGEEWVNLTDNQLECPWTVGGENLVTVSYLGFEGESSVELLPNPVASISYKSEHEYIEGIDCWEREDDNGETYFDYSIHCQDGDVLTVNYVNGDTVNYTMDYSLWEFVSDNEEYEDLTINNISFYDNQYNEHWSVGADNTFEVEFNGRRAAVTAKVIPNPVKTIELIREVDAMTLADENCWEDYDWNNDEYYTYYNFPGALVGDILKVTMNDGAVKQYLYNKYGEFVNIEDADDIIDEYFVSDYQYDEHFKTGKNYYYITCLGKTTEVPFYVSEGIVESIEYNRSAPFYCLENCDGEYVGGVFMYNSENLVYECVPDSEITINYTDGAKLKLRYDSDFRNLCNVIDKYNNFGLYSDDLLTFECVQSVDAPWKCGSGNKIRVSCGDACTYIDATVLKFNSAKDTIILEQSENNEFWSYMKLNGMLEFRGDYDDYGAPSARLGTGCKVELYESLTWVGEYAYIVVNGDIDGDGCCDVLDMVLVERMLSSGESFGDLRDYAANGEFCDEITAESYQNTVNMALR